MYPAIRIFHRALHQVFILFFRDFYKRISSIFLRVILGIEGFLQLFHMGFHSSLGISLHLRINSGIDFQSIEVKIVFSTIGFRVLVNPRFHIRTEILTEVGCHPIIMTFGGKLNLQWQFLQRIFLFLSDIVVLSHLGEYHVAAIGYPFFIFYGIVEGRVFEHSH